jgi:hypothetical protein
METAYVVGFVPVRDGNEVPMFSVFSEETPTAPLCVQWTQLKVKADGFQEASFEATRMMDADSRFVRVDSSIYRPTWKIATYEQFRLALGGV